MVKYECDMCGKSITLGEDIRYVVKIEVYATCDSMECENDFDEEMIEDFEEEDDDDEMDNFDPDDSDDEAEDDYKTFRFDLCSKCHSKYLQDPLMINTIRRGRISEN